jgi:hypothetical protein
MYCIEICDFIECKKLCFIDFKLCLWIHFLYKSYVFAKLTNFHLLPPLKCGLRHPHHFLHCTLSKIFTTGSLSSFFTFIFLPFLITHFLLHSRFCLHVLRTRYLIIISSVFRLGFLENWCGSYFSYFSNHKSSQIAVFFLYLLIFLIKWVIS